MKVILSLLAIVLITILAGCVDEKQIVKSPTISTSSNIVKEYLEFTTVQEFSKWYNNLSYVDKLTDLQREQLVAKKVNGKYVRWEGTTENVYGNSISLQSTYKEDTTGWQMNTRTHLEVSNIDKNILTSININDKIKYEGRIEDVGGFGEPFIVDVTILEITKQ